MEDFTVVPQSLIKMLKTYAEKGYEPGDQYDMGVEDGQTSLAQAVLGVLNIPYTKFELKEKL